MEERGKAKGYRRPTDAEKGRKQSLLLDSSEGTSPDDTLTSFNLLNLILVNLYCFKALSL